MWLKKANLALYDMAKATTEEFLSIHYCHYIIHSCQQQEIFLAFKEFRQDKDPLSLLFDVYVGSFPIGEAITKWSRPPKLLQSLRLSGITYFLLSLRWRKAVLICQSKVPTTYSAQLKLIGLKEGQIFPQYVMGFMEMCTRSFCRQWRHCRCNY